MFILVLAAEETEIVDKLSYLYASFSIGKRSYAIACSVSSCSSGEIGSNPRSMINN